MLHFLGDKLDVVCICVCDWGEVECLQEVTSSLYDFAEDQDATNIKKNALVGCTIIVFVYNKLGIANSPRPLAKQHAATLTSKTYLVGRLASVIWGDDWDAKYFVDNSIKISFRKLIHDMYDPNLEA
jgi:hypothetical protein